MSVALVERLRSEGSRLAKVVALCALAMFPPMVAGRIILGEPATTMLLFGAMVGFLNTAIAGRRVGAAAALAFVLVAPVAVMAGENPLAGASLMALGALLIGGASYWARLAKLGPTVLVGMVFLVGAPTAVSDKMIGGAAETRYLVAVLVATAVAAFWPVVVLPKLVPLTPTAANAHNPLAGTIGYTTALTVLLGGTTFWALEAGRSIHGMWLPLTIVLVLQVTPQATRHRLAHRLVGTTLGAATAVAIVTFIHSGVVIHVLLVVALLGVYATMGREPYGLFVFFLTIVVLIGVSVSEPVIRGGEERVLFTLIGVVLAAVALVVSQAVVRRVSHS